MRVSRTVLRTLLTAVLASAPSTSAAQARIPDEFTNLRFLPEDIQQREPQGFARKLKWAAAGPGGQDLAFADADALTQVGPIG